MTEGELLFGIKEKFSPREFAGFIKRRFMRMLRTRDLRISQAGAYESVGRSKPEAIAYHFEHGQAREKITVLGCWQRDFPISVAITFADGKQLAFHEYASGKKRTNIIIDATLTKSLYGMIADRSERQK